LNKYILFEFFTHLPFLPAVAAAQAGPALPSF